MSRQLLVGPSLVFRYFDRPIERDELRIVELGNVDAEAMMDRGDEVQEIHRIDVERLAQVGVGIDRCQIDLRRDVAEFFPKRPREYRLQS